ncbi:MAG TPA: bifunctional homocysteine S-methyltransferase/methylenetetrahydrofolate reductase, partial [Bacilli bacterium]
MKHDLREALKNQILVGDGAMGTYLYQLGFPVGISYEELNLSRPEVIADVHRRYYEAGARVIETNTFSANREKLAKYGLEEQTAEINRAGAAIARNAVGADAYVLGAVGSIRVGKRKNVRSQKLKEDFHEQISALVDSGVDGLLFETFYDLEELLIALQMARQVSNLPVVCQFAVEDTARTNDGIPLGEAFARLIESGADAVGFNCRSGPNGIMRSIARLPEDFAFPLSIFPNAGLPDYVDGRITYKSTPEYFADCAVKFAGMGAKIIGGCCGTTPEHINAISAALDSVQKNMSTGAPALEKFTLSEADAEPLSEQRAEDTNGTSEAVHEGSIIDLVRSRHTVIVELDPPRDLDLTRFMEGASLLKQAGADAITMADNSLAVTRMSNMAVGTLLKEKLGIRPIVHIACRDRNLIGTQSHLMGLHALGI